MKRHLVTVIPATEVLNRSRSWRDRAVCGVDPLWLEKPEHLQLEDCHRCPVVQECLAHAIECQQTQVVQGGLAIGNNPLESITMTNDVADDSWTITRVTR